MKNKKKKLKLHVKLDHVLDAFLNGKLWRKWWNYCQNRTNINYFFISALGRLFERIDKYSFEEFDLYCIGHSHLDACWLWTKLSTIRRAIITFQQNIEYFEKYPFYTFSQTTPQYYDWVRRLRPKIFQKIQEYEKLGRLEIIGGMWVEPDLNLPNGESLVRQRLYGQLFYLEHFGKISRIECLEDSFGFNAQLPQILVKSGAEIFWTGKITWNDLTEFPFANFLWRGIDGSEIFTHIYQCNWAAFISLSLYKRSGRRITKPNLIFDSSSEKEFIESCLSDEWIKTCGIFFGFGDGGMGPIREEIEILRKLTKGKPLSFCNFDQYFKKLRRDCGEILPIWNDELYLEVHRGVYTTQANTKKLNRFCEISLRNWEILLSLALLMFKNFSYPSKALEKVWKILLFNQFHDILPGSSIQDVYYEQEKEMETILQKMNNSISMILQSLLRTLLKINNITDKNQMKNYAIIFNSLAWERDGILKISNESEDASEEILYLKNIKPLSFRFIDFQKLKQENSIEKKKLKIDYQKKNLFIENSIFQIRINQTTGNLTSIVYKKTNREIIRSPDGIGIHIYKEKRRKNPAWNIYRGYTSNKLDQLFVKEFKIIVDTPKIITLKFIYIFKKTKIHHYISLRSDSDLIEFRTDINTHDKSLFFKVRFPFNLETDFLTAEIPYGNIRRKIIAEKYYEKGKWEFPAQKYVDISESNMGLTILNNSKYGFSSNKNGIFLSLLRTPPRASSIFYSYIDLVPKKERTKCADIGKHSIDYALWIHEGDFIESCAWKKGYEYNYPLLFERFNKSTSFNLDNLDIRKDFKDSLKEQLSLISISNPNIILQVIKSPEKKILELEKSSIHQVKENLMFIIRFFESSGNSQQDVEIIFNDFFEILNVAETDLLERELNSSELNLKSNKIKLNFKKFEIKTIKLKVSIKK
ncbi:MAG: alpha-mannosidase [Promethearchaeota archaeon]